MALRDILLSLPLAGILIALNGSVYAAGTRTQEDDKDIFNVVFENDLFTGTDRGYTNGLRFAWLSSEENAPDWLRWPAVRLPLLSPEGNKRISVAIGQSIFAPDDLSRRDVIVDDRPYAGWLYGTIGVVSDTGKTLDNVALTLGVVGPLSHAQQAQTFIHRVVDSPRPQGWNNQLKNEPGINFTYERKWRGIFEASPFGLGVDAVPHMGVSLGNINTNANIGTTLRLGYDLPADYGPPRIRPSLPGSDFFIPTKEIGGYLFTTIEGRAVGRDIFLDGNTFQDSHSVDKKIMVGSLQVGAALTYDSMRLSYTQVFMTRQFETESKPEQFGALTLSVRF
jgi:lipid A 3-O-deacylase